MKGFIYFLLRSSPSGKYKIGFSRDPHKRVKEINRQNCDPVELVGYVEGSRGLENTVHTVLKEYRCKGEWYPADCEPVIEFICTALDYGIKEAIAREDERPKVSRVKPGELSFKHKTRLEMQAFVDDYGVDSK